MRRHGYLTISPSKGSGDPTRRCTLHLRVRARGHIGKPGGAGVWFEKDNSMAQQWDKSIGRIRWYSEYIGRAHFMYRWAVAIP